MGEKKVPSPEEQCHWDPHSVCPKLPWVSRGLHTSVSELGPWEGDTCGPASLIWALRETSSDPGFWLLQASVLLLHSLRRTREMKLEEGYLKKETIGCQCTGRRMLTNAAN